MHEINEREKKRKKLYKQKQKPNKNMKKECTKQKAQELLTH